MAQDRPGDRGFEKKSDEERRREIVGKDPKDTEQKKK